MAVPNVWTQMNYVAPRGQCNYKQSVLSPKCPCLRFMLHPLKFASSYECDGCNHHASFHSMENKTEDEIRKRWEQEAKDKAEREEEAQERPKKRVRTIEYHAAARVVDGDELEEIFGTENQRNKTAGGRGAAAKKTTRPKPMKRGKKVTEVVEEEGDMVVELD